MWFRKKEVGLLPELPESAELPRLPGTSSNNYNENIPGLKLTSLPALPDESIVQSAIKQAVSDETIIREPRKKDFDTNFDDENFMAQNSARKIIAEPVKMMEFPRTIELSEKLEKSKNTKIRSIEPVYVRLDKFKTSLETFEEIKNKVSEIGDLLEKIRDVKQKEEKELE
ncbi:MAG: hypothetical protein AABX77_00190, partial [Nanoarchaeota archaeon]